MLLKAKSHGLARKCLPRPHTVAKELKELKETKVVYQDGDYTKVVYGSAEIKEDFVSVKKKSGNTIILGKRFVISIEDIGGD